MTQILLVADDDPTVRAIVSATVALDEFTVVQAENGDRAWELLQQHSPAWALLDVNMPGRSGLELARAIKSDPGLSGTKVVLLTGMGMDSDIEAGRAAGADHYLVKPFSPLQLLNIIAD
jgi:CheY-like chemotaxis protein